MNLHTFAITAMREDMAVEKRYQSILETLETAYRCLAIVTGKIIPSG